jgi:hypothetical protein
MRPDWKAQRQLRRKAEKVVDQTHLTYCWLRADQATVQLGQLKRSHELTPVVSSKNAPYFDHAMDSILCQIGELKSMIKDYQEHLKSRKGKR